MGTICYRSEEPVRGNRKADLYVRRKYFYKRLGIDALVKTLQSTGRFEICVYTSMMRHNVEAGLNAILPGLRPSLARVFDRKYNKPDPNAVYEWDTIRDMEKIWRELPGFGPKKTILLDNEERKFKENPENGIVVPEFGPQEVIQRKQDTLDVLTRYLVELADESPDDVRDYLERYPFNEHDSSSEGSSQKGEDEEDAFEALLQQVKGLSLLKDDIGVSSGTGTHGDRLRSMVSKGTRLHLVCIEDGRFTCKTQGGTRHVSVSGPSKAGLRVDAKSDYHRLLTEAEAANVTLEVTIDDDRYDFVPDAKNLAAVF
eukprot:jgi/Botrbrau1/18376/Bobra.0747s0002.1